MMKSVLYFCSCIALCCIFPNLYGNYLISAFLLLFLIFIYLTDVKSHSSTSQYSILHTICIATFISLIFINSVSSGATTIESRLNDASVLFGVQSKHIAAFFLCALSLPCIFHTTSWLTKEAEYRQINTLSSINSTEHRLVKLLILAIIIISVCVLAYYIPSPDVWMDEAATISITNSSFRWIISLAAMDVHPPLYYCITKAISSTIDACFNLEYDAYSRRFVSSIPLLLQVCLCFSIIKKNWGNGTAILASLCIISAPHMLEYGVEIRMYSWGCFFVTAAYISALEALKNNNFISWCLFTISGISAAYTHYFACLTVSFIYIFCIFWSIRISKKTFISCIASTFITAILYSPWLFKWGNQVTRISNHGFWIPEMTLQKIYSLLTFPFVNSCFAFVIIGIIISLSITKKKGGITSLHHSYVILGILAPALTAAIGIIISYCFEPILMERYLVPSLGCFWIACCISLSMLASNRLKIITIGLILLCSVTSTYQFIQNEQKNKNSTILFYKAIKNYNNPVFIGYNSLNLCNVPILTGRTTYAWKNGAPSLYSSEYKISPGTEHLISLIDKGHSIFFIEYHKGQVQSFCEDSNLHASLITECRLSVPISLYQITKAPSAGGSYNITK